MFKLKWITYRNILPLLLLVFTSIFVMKTTRLMNILHENHTKQEIRFGYSLSKVISLEKGLSTRNHFSTFDPSQPFEGRIKKYINSAVRRQISHRNATSLMNFNVNTLKHPAVVLRNKDARKNHSEENEVSDVKNRLFLTILVISCPDRVLFRQAIRKTWGRYIRGWQSVIQFVVGRQENWDDIVDRERKMHGDMLIIEEQDTYENLPNKVLDGMTLVMQNDIVPEFVMKVDDDTFVNIPFLMQELLSGILNSSSILGSVCSNLNVERDFTNKWALSELDYPYQIFPPHVFGGAYVTSSTALDAILRSRSTVFDWVHLEDVFITGILAKKAGLKLRDHSCFSVRNSEKANACDFVLDKRINSLHMGEKEFFYFYSEVQELLRTYNISHCKGVTGLSTS